jgi:hypothetical protein
MIVTSTAITSPTPSTTEASLPKTPTPVRRSRQSTRISKPKHKANPKPKPVAKAKTTYVCENCGKNRDPSNLRRHDRTCSALTPVFSARKDFKCHFKGCTSKGFTRVDNLKVHQTKQGHSTTAVGIQMPVEREPSPEWGGQPSLLEQMHERHNLIHGIMM